MLDVGDIRKLWSDPILRFSNVLDGLFHESVVVTESDGDCRFFAAVLEAIHNSENAKPDVLFSSSGGKDRIPVITSSLVSLGVPTRVVADFDVLREEQPLRGIVSALGGNWSDIENDWRQTKMAVEQKAPPLKKNQVRQQIDDILNTNTQDRLSLDSIERIRDTLRATSSWDLAKQTGVEIISAGQPRERMNTLLKTLRKIGLFVVECGELERFVPTIGGHGPKWVTEVLKRDLGTDKELDGARAFVAELFAMSPSIPPPKHHKAAESNPSQDRRPTRAQLTWKGHIAEIFHHLACLFGCKN